MRLDPEEQFWRKVEKTDTCWLWTGALSPNGYGTATCVRLIAAGLVPEGTCRVAYVHRIAYMLGNRRHLARDEHIDHLCRNRRCVRPDHLEAVSQAENTRRTIYNPRNRKGERDHCGRGHVYTEETVRWTRSRSGGHYRACRVCDAENARRRSAQKKSA